MNVGETKQIGPYFVRAVLRNDNPAFPRYLIFKGDDLIGKQFSMPGEADCKWHEFRNGQYAQEQETKADPRWQLNISPKRGRPSNAERARRLAVAHLEAQAETTCSLEALST